MWIAALLAVLIPAMTYANFILNHFYVQGAYFWDSGVVAGAIWRRDAWLTYASLFPIGSLYAYHVMPLLSLLTVASCYLPIGLPGWFALFTGVGHALPAAGVFWLLTEGLGLRSRRGLMISLGLAVGFAFSGIAIATILFPHPEIYLAGGLILVCTAVALEHYWIAAACLVFTLLVREDAGFHAFGILFLLAAANLYRHRQWREQRWILILASIGFIWSVGAVLFKQIVFPGQPPLFVEDYLGDPPFANISLELVLTRFAGLPIYRAYVFWPGVAALAWAVWSRNVLIAVGYLAFVPWLLLHLMANRDIPGTLSGYYAFPFLVACAWPVVAVVIDARQRVIRPDPRVALTGFAVMIGLSFPVLSTLWNPGQVDPWRNFITLPSFAKEQATDKAMELLIASAAAPTDSVFGTIFMDQHIYSLSPYSFSASRVIAKAKGTVTESDVPVDTIVYFESGATLVRVLRGITQANLTRTYRFRGTSIRLASNRNLDDVIGLEAVPPDTAIRK